MYMYNIVYTDASKPQKLEKNKMQLNCAQFWFTRQSNWFIRISLPLFRCLPHNNKGKNRFNQIKMLAQMTVVTSKCSPYIQFKHLQWTVSYLIFSPSRPFRSVLEPCTMSHQSFQLSDCVYDVFEWVNLICVYVVLLYNMYVVQYQKCNFVCNIRLSRIMGEWMTSLRPIHIWYPLLFPQLQQATNLLTFCSYVNLHCHSIMSVQQTVYDCKQVLDSWRDSICDRA